MPERPDSCATATAAIAVVIPVRNRSLMVKRAIDSVLCQEFADFELIVVDDGSTDDSVAVIAAIADPRLKLLRQPERRGANAARNRGIRESTAPIIAFLDSDDEFLPEKLGQIVERFRREPDLGALLDSYLIVWDDRQGPPQVRRNPVIESSDEFLAALFGCSIRCKRLLKSASATSLRREVALAAGLFDEAIDRRQDIEFLARVAKTARCASSDRPLWVKHHTSDSITATSRGFIPATIVICRRNPEFLTNPALRGALAHDILRHLHAALREGKWRALREDIRLLLAEFGWSQLIRVLTHRLTLNRDRRLTYHG
jgi:glycosyltransferase involved in cell wall biosynthesis